MQNKHTKGKKTDILVMTGNYLYSTNNNTVYVLRSYFRLEEGESLRFQHWTGACCACV